MGDTNTTWLEHIASANRLFRQRIDTEKLPVERLPGHAVVTCMDPRVNLESIGVAGFGAEGQCGSTARIIRTIGGMADDRSLIVGVFLAGIREAVVLMHTDCGCCLAHSKTDVMVANMATALSTNAYQNFRSEVGEPFEDKLRTYLRTFEDPREAVKQEISRIRRLPFSPRSLVLHGLLYELKSGTVEVVVNGYEEE